MEEQKYAEGGIVKPTRFSCPICGNMAWQYPIFVNKPLCKECGTYMEEDNQNEVTEND